MSYLILTTLLLSLPAFANYTETFQSHLRTGTLTATSITSGTSTILSKTIIPAMPSPSFKGAFAISALHQQDSHNSSEYYFQMYMNSLSTTYFQLGVYSSTTNSSEISFFEVRYLLVVYNFPYLTIFPAGCVPSSGSNQYSNSAPLGPFSFTIGSVQLSATEDELLYFINGYQLISPNGMNGVVSLQANCSIAYANTVECFVTTPINGTFYIYRFNMDVVVVHQGKLKTETGGQWIVGEQKASGTGAIFFNSAQNIWGNNFLYGFKELTRQMTGQLPWDFNLTSSNTTLEVSLGPYSQTITVFYIYFNSIDINCVNESYWNSTRAICVSCLPGQYVNGMNLCADCSDLDLNCVTCSAGVCLACQGLMIFYGGNCSTCGDAWSNCIQCNSSLCLNCTVEYQLNSSNQCFRCEDLWQNCSECDQYNCSNCTDPYQLSINNQCFLCEDRWANCSECTATGCLNCTLPLLLNWGICKECWQLWPNCLQCNSSSCLNCTDNYAIIDPNCVTCDVKWLECSQCDESGCFNCSEGYFTNGTYCFRCDLEWEGCNLCSNLTCLGCDVPYFVNGSNCSADCSLIDNCSLCTIISKRLRCDQCSSGYIISSDQTSCLPQCGDGILMDSEQCDDNNTINKDGCSQFCTVEDYFQCQTINSSSVCMLTQMEVNVVSMVKTEDKNQVVLSMDIVPKDVVYYQGVNWIDAFEQSSHQLKADWATFDPQTGRLRVTLSYGQSLQNQQVTLFSNFSLLSQAFNLSTVSLTLPQRTSNNQALYFYSSSIYSIASAVNYLAYLVGGITILMLIFGYFGCKLQSIEGIAVVQVSTLLLMTVQNMGPTYNGLKKMKISLGITLLFQNSYTYLDSRIPSHIFTIFSQNKSISLINLFLIVLFVPLVISAILKILSLTKYKDNYRMYRAWKYTLGSYTFYGLLFLAYGELASLAVSARYFQDDTECLIGLTIGIIFTILFVAWIIGLCKHPFWFGSFKNKFYIFQISRYFYVFSSIQRLLTVALLVCLSPGLISSACACAIFSAEAVFIAVKDTYGLGGWKRPLFNKIISAVICLLFVGASVTSADSTINQFIPLVILTLLLAVEIVAIIGSIQELKLYWKEKIESKNVADDKEVPPMPVQEAQKLLLRQFQLKMMPATTITNNPLWRPVQHEPIDINKWRWQQYPIVHVGQSLKMQMKQKIQKLKKQLDEEQDQEVEICEAQSSRKLEVNVKQQMLKEGQDAI